MKFLLGILIGTAVGLILAPASGEETRERLYEKARDLGELPQQKVADLVEQNKQKFSDAGARLGRKAAETVVENITEDLRGGEKRA